VQCEHTNELLFAKHFQMNFRIIPSLARSRTMQTFMYQNQNDVIANMVKRNGVCEREKSIGDDVMCKHTFVRNKNCVIIILLFLNCEILVLMSQFFLLSLSL
jgi:hypothetical protein